VRFVERVGHHAGLVRIVRPGPTTSRRGFADATGGAGGNGNDGGDGGVGGASCALAS